MSWRNTGRSFRERNDIDYTNSFDDLPLTDVADLAVDYDDRSIDMPIDMSTADNLVDLEDMDLEDMDLEGTVSDEDSDEDLLTEISYRRNPQGSRLAYD